MEVSINWQTGEGSITATFDGYGDGVISITSSYNEGIDRSQELSVHTTNGDDISHKVTINQLGMREIFQTSYHDFILSDGGTFNVLKQ